ncbi:hypothetical protein [Streptomyces sp. NPDC014734]|uniref:hypothetical protein n=1 Tax=Streptomyces sp. NPDC014734 TaxID=3364886 RepID=UPI0037035186
MPVVRLALLRCEVDEVLRKRDWRTRHEVRGVEEAQVARRASAALDGRVRTGLPAPRGSDSTADRADRR